MSIFVNGRWEWYLPEWPAAYRDYIDRLRAEGARMQPLICCRKCGKQHYDPHINGCASVRDSKDRTHEPDWGTLI